MPTIYKPKKKKNIDSASYKKRRKIYNSKLWQDMRIAYMQNHPLCEVCQMEGKSKLSEHVHHLISFVQVPEELMQNYAYDSNNFCSVCAECHNELHNGKLKNCRNKDEIRQKLQDLSKK